jgi:peptidoglycan/LPS O-acetylase OafA/YrhL
MSYPATERQEPNSAVLSLSGRVPELDGIRGIAIGLVLIAHCFLLVTQPGTPLAYALVPLRLCWSGVDVFFVLSGFLIGGILIDARKSTNYFRVFYTRRFFRIIPIYAALLLCVACAIALSDSGVIRNHSEVFTDRLPWLYFPLFLQNIGMSRHNVWGTLPLGLTWSLAVEEQFYLTLPLIIRLLNRRALLWFIAVAVPAAPLLRTFLYHRDPSDFFSWYTLMPCRADGLLLGVLGAIAVREPLWRAWLLARRRLFQVIVGILLLGLAFLGWRSPSNHSPLMASIGFTWLALTYLVFLLYAVLFVDSRVSGYLRWGWLRSLGIISYGTYLFHEFILGMLFGRTPFLRSLRDVGLSLVAVALTLIVCRLSWVYFEKPLVKIGHRMTYQFGIATPAADSAAVSVEAR